MFGNGMLRLLLVLLCAGFTLTMACDPAIAGNPPPTIPGSCWETTGTWKVPGGKGMGWADACFGPQSGLTADRYLIRFTDGYDPFTVTGTFGLQKGKIKWMTVDTAPLLSQLRAMFRPYDIDVIAIDKTKMKCKAKASKKKGESLKVQFSVKFVASAYGRSKKISMKWKTEGPRDVDGYEECTPLNTVNRDSLGLAIANELRAHNAAIVGSTESPAARPGNTVIFDLRGRPDGAFQAALSFGNSGINLGAPGTVPLTYDALCHVSLIGALPDLTGTLDAAGAGTASVAIPNSPVLIGQTFYCAFINTGPIDHISNAHRVTIN